MKKMMTILAALCLFLCSARAESLPNGVQRLCADAYPGYAVLAQDGYDDGITGQWAVVLHKDGDNALVIAEKTGGGNYALSVNTRTPCRTREKGIPTRRIR